MLKSHHLRLQPPEVEARFRAASLSSDRRRATAVVAVSIIFHAASFPADVSLMGASENFYWVTAIRIAGVIGGLIALLFVRLDRGVPFFDATVLAWAVFLCANVVTANALLPADYTIHLAWDVLLTLGAYTVIPFSIERQALAAAIVSIGDILLFAGHKIYAYPTTFLDVVLAFICANLVGFFASWEMHRWRRSQFISFERERDAREKLEAARHEIQTLRGILPICASCKKIRTDEGTWRQIEAYVRDHSAAEFSHSICPQCSEALYGESESD